MVHLIIHASVSSPESRPPWSEVGHVMRDASLIPPVSSSCPAGRWRCVLSLISSCQIQTLTRSCRNTLRFVFFKTFQHFQPHQNLPRGSMSCARRQVPRRKCNAPPPPQSHRRLGARQPIDTHRLHRSRDNSKRWREQLRPISPDEEPPAERG